MGRTGRRPCAGGLVPKPRFTCGFRRSWRRRAAVAPQADTPGSGVPLSRPGHTQCSEQQRGHTHTGGLHCAPSRRSGSRGEPWAVSSGATLLGPAPVTRQTWCATQPKGRAGAAGCRAWTRSRTQPWATAPAGYGRTAAAASAASGPVGAARTLTLLRFTPQALPHAKLQPWWAQGATKALGKAQAELGEAQAERRPWPCQSRSRSVRQQPQRTTGKAA